ncbi:MAG: hypothetical protein HC906_11865 [Bacteroidales bacterium]|nr:hypothetical protein [Bacteroidales bacterium]
MVYIEMMNNGNEHIDVIGLLPGYFSNEIGPEERKLVENWLTDENNRKEFESFSRLWNLTASDASRKDINIDEEWKKLEKTISPSMLLNQNWFRIAATILVFVFSYLLVKQLSTVTEKAPGNSVAVVNMPDGSIVTLNAGSKISYTTNFGKKTPKPETYR